MGNVGVTKLINNHFFSKMSSGLSEDEAKLYDRQIRLWGVDAQKKFYFKKK